MRRSPVILVACCLVMAACKKDAVVPPEPAVLDGISYRGLPIKDSALRFTVRGNNIASYKWDFGDGAKSTEAQPVHTFSAVGTYTVTLVANNNAMSLKTMVMRVTAAPAVSPIFPAGVTWRHFRYNYFSTGVKDTLVINTQTLAVSGIDAVTAKVAGDTVYYNLGTDSTAYYNETLPNSTGHSIWHTLYYKHSATDTFIYSVHNQVSPGGAEIDQYYYP